MPGGMKTLWLKLCHNKVWAGLSHPEEMAHLLSLPWAQKELCIPVCVCTHVPSMRLPPPHLSSQIPGPTQNEGFLQHSDASLHLWVKPRENACEWQSAMNSSHKDSGLACWPVWVRQSLTAVTGVERAQPQGRRSSTLCARSHATWPWGCVNCLFLPRRQSSALTPWGQEVSDGEIGFCFGDLEEEVC